MANLFHILSDGGILISYIILAVLIVIIALFLKELIFKKKSSKTIPLLNSLGWFAVAWGFLGRTIGLIRIFDLVEAAGDISPSLIAGGLKMGLVGPLLGIIVFILARVFILVLISIERKEMRA